MHDTPVSIRGVILAGGESTRFDTVEDKALARIESENILDRTTTVLETVTQQQPVIAVRTAEQHSTYSAHVSDDAAEYVFDDPDYEGPVAGLLGAADVIEAEWIICCGCDMPLLSERALTWLTDLMGAKLDGKRSHPDAFAIRYADGTVEPLHTLYRRERVLEMRSQSAQIVSPRELLSKLPHVYTIPVDTVPDEIPLAASTTNVNTAEELATVRNDSSR